MKPPQFAYHAPVSVPEAVDVLGRYAGGGRLLAGGQSLIPMLNFRLLAPEALIDLGGIGALAYIRDEGEAVAIGAMTRQRAAEHSPVIAAKVPLMREVLGWVGHLPTRSRGTIGGSLAHADPSAELPMMLRALEGSVVAVGPQGQRTIDSDALFESYFTTSLAQDEILTEIRIPAMAAGSAFAVEEFARRKGDFAIVGICVVLVRAGARCAKARIVAAGVASGPERLRAAEEILEREGLGADAVRAASDQGAGSVDPGSDTNGSADFRRHLVGVLVERALQKALGSSLKES